MITEEPVIPSEDTIRSIISQEMNSPAVHVSRFPTGLCHFVYDVRTESGEAVVVRISSPESLRYLEGALYWSDRLRPLGVPLPKILGSNLASPYPYMILERLPGTDLGHCYLDLTFEQKKIIAGQICGLQTLVSSMPPSKRFGFAFSYEDESSETASSWLRVLKDHIERSRD